MISTEEIFVGLIVIGLNLWVISVTLAVVSGCHCMNIVLCWECTDVWACSCIIYMTESGCLTHIIMPNIAKLTISWQVAFRYKKHISICSRPVWSTAWLDISLPHWLLSGPGHLAGPVVCVCINWRMGRVSLQEDVLQESCRSPTQARGLQEVLYGCTWLNVSVCW